jgi:hypothetical protein
MVDVRWCSCTADLEKTRCTLYQHINVWNETATSSFLDDAAPSCRECMKKNNEREAIAVAG